MINVLLEFLSHQSLIGFFGPHGPSFEETQGLLTSTTLFEHDDKKVNKAKNINKFFIASCLKLETLKIHSTKNLITKNLKRELEMGELEMGELSSFYDKINENLN